MTVADRASDYPLATAGFRLVRLPTGQLHLSDEQGQRHSGVVPVRAFPLSAPGHGISLLGADGRELVWIGDLQALPHHLRALIEEELDQRDFVPQITRLVDVDSFGTPSTWTVETDRGPTTFVLAGEEDIRRLEEGALLIADRQGVQFRVPDVNALDRVSRRLLERFL